MPGPVWVYCLLGAFGFTLMVFAAIFGTPTREVSELDGYRREQ